MTSESFVRAIVRADRRTAEAEARRAFLQHGLAYVYEELVTPALAEVGALWEADRLSVTDEHIATATAHAAVATLYPDVRWPPRGPKAVVAAVQGERHCFGARMVSDLLALDGWDDVYLGGKKSPEEVAAIAKRESSSLVALSATLPAHLGAVRETVQAVRGAAPRAKILVGGRGLRDAGEAAALGADLIALSASGGVSAARQFKS